MERKTQGRILALFCLLFLPALAFSQIMVKGTVKAEDGFGMPGANVLLKGSTNGTITDVDGTTAYLFHPKNRYWFIVSSVCLRRK